MLVCTCMCCGWSADTKTRESGADHCDAHFEDGSDSERERNIERRRNEEGARPVDLRHSAETEDAVDLTGEQSDGCV